MINEALAELLLWAADVHNAVATLASYAPGGGRAIPSLVAALAHLDAAIDASHGQADTVSPSPSGKDQ